jgi:iron complex outermembrane receptor protein
MNKLIILLVLLFVFEAVASELAEPDTLKTYKLGEVEVTDSRQKVSKIKEVESVDIPYYVIQNSDVISVSDLQLYIPSGVVRTNSRGESMLFIRGAGERQLGLFFDGMYMNIPWDNRLDLTFVPADIIGNIKVNKSANSILYGPNVLGGAVSISTVERTNPGYGLSLKAQAGDGNLKNYSILHDGKVGNFNYLANISYYSRDGFVMSGNAPDDLGNQNNNSSLRTNTDEERTSYYFRGEYHFSDKSIIGASVSHTKQNKGVAPETFAGEDARFWRFPIRERTFIILNGSFELTKSINLKSTLWSDMFSQTIEDYPDIEYDFTTDFSQDSDYTFGTRISLNYSLNDKNRLSFVLNGFTTKHKTVQRIDFEPNGGPPYKQNTLSTGAEYSGLFNKLEINTGAGFDYNETPSTGFFKEAEGTSQSDFAGFLSIKYLLSDELAIVASSSRRTRFPTMREQYDGALGSFKTNPDLKAETGLLNEAGIVFANDRFNLKAVGFFNLYDDLIERIRLSEEEDPERRRMRVNYANATISGADISFEVKPLRMLSINGFYTYMNTSAEQDGVEIEHLVQKPEMLAGLNAVYSFDFGLSTTLETEYTGVQWDNDINGDYVELDPTISFNLRLGYRFMLGDISMAELFVRLNNLTDEYILSQYGLPEPGRTLYSGFSFRI